MNKRIFLFSWLMMTVFTASAQVQTTSGLVSGTDQEGSMAFLGGSQIMRANIVFYSILTFPLSVFEYEMLKRAYAPSSSVFL